MIRRDSYVYRAVRFVGKLVLIGAGFVFGKRWKKRPIDKGFPENK